MLSPRRTPAVVPLNSNEIAILGGSGEFGYYLNDVILFNTKTGEYNRAIGNGKIKFRANKNYAVLTSNNNVVACVVCESGLEVLI